MTTQINTANQSEVLAGQTTFQSTGITAVERAITAAETQLAAQQPAQSKPASKKPSKPAAKVEKVKAELAPNARKGAGAEKAQLAAEQTSKAAAEKEKALAVKTLGVLTDKIRKEVDGVSKSFCRIGYFLWQIRDGKLYEQTDCKNISEYGERFFNFKKSSTFNYIRVCEEFSERTSGRPSAKLRDGFSLFSFTQLTELLSLPDGQRDNVKPEMTVKQIRGLRAEQYESDEGGEYAESVATLSKGKQAAVTVLWNRVLDLSNFDVFLKIMRDNIGKEISVKLIDL